MAILVLAGLAAGCCAYPGLFDRLECSLKTVQAYYEPLLQEELANEKVHRAVVAADTALLLAGELQRQWCPTPQAAEQLELQVQEAEKLAAAAGVQLPEETSREEQK
jgi:hypothetical protein